MKYDWTIERDGQPIGRLSEPEYEEMFWHTAILTPSPNGGETVENLFKDEYWQDCQYTVRHTFSGKILEHVIIRAFGKPDRLLIRGIPVD